MHTQNAKHVGQLHDCSEGLCCLGFKRGCYLVVVMTMLCQAMPFVVKKLTNLMFNMHNILMWITCSFLLKIYVKSMNICKNACYFYCRYL